MHVVVIVEPVQHVGVLRGNVLDRPRQGDDETRSVLLLLFPLLTHFVGSVRFWSVQLVSHSYGAKTQAINGQVSCHLSRQRSHTQPSFGWKHPDLKGWPAFGRTMVLDPPFPPIHHSDHLDR
jgi:hypothetical protein